MKVLYTLTLRGRILFELQTHRNASRDRESLVSILKFKPWVKGKHRNRELELGNYRNMVAGPYQRVVHSPVSMNLN